MKAQEKFICNGKIFYSFEEVEKYVRNINMRITNTETLKTPKGTRNIISINS